MITGYWTKDLLLGKPWNFVIQLFNSAIYHLINLKKKIHFSNFNLSAFNLPACHFLLLFKKKFSSLTSTLLYGQQLYLGLWNTILHYCRINIVWSHCRDHCVLSTKNALTRKLSFNGHPLWILFLRQCNENEAYSVNREFDFYSHGVGTRFTNIWVFFSSILAW